MSTGMRARMAKMPKPMRMRMKQHHKSMLDQCRIWRTDLGRSDVDRYEDKDGDNVDADEKEEASQADDESMQNMEDRGHSTRQCEDWTVYFRPVIYDNGAANAKANEV